jgi:type IV pilus assembly protein PilY1
VLITSGNRTHPLGNVVDNQFYALRDFSLDKLPDLNQDGQADAKDSSGNDTTFSTSDLSDLVDLTNNIIQTGSNAERTAVINDQLRPSNGWYINLIAEPGEKGLASPVVLDGKVYFTTYSPPDLTGETVCSVSNDGNSRFYALDIFTAGAAFNFDGEGADDDPDNFKATDRSQMLREGITSDIVPMFMSNGDIRLLSNDLSLLGQESFATIQIVPTFWMQE